MKLMWKSAALVILAALTLPACSSGGGSSPTAPTVTPATENFTGTLHQGETVTHTFTVKLTGEADIGLTAVAPLSTLALGVAVGSWDGTTCAIIAQNDNARQGVLALTGTATVGNFCAQVYDSGNVTADAEITYTLTVIHY